MLLITRRLLNARLIEAPEPAAEILLTDKLRPAEVGYLLRGGDVTHALVILGADVLQRTLKTGDDSTSLIAPYELNMWKFAKDSVKDWANKKKEEYLPGDPTKDPIVYATRVGKLYKFFAKTVRDIAGDLIKDPKHLRRYISWAGVMHFVTDFAARGYKQAFERDLKADLIGRGMLVAEARRRKFSSYFLLAASISLSASLAIDLCFIRPWPAALTIWLLTLIGAIAARAVFALVEFIPLYSELSAVVSTLQRNSRRLSILRMLIRLVMLLCLAAVLVVFVISISFDALVLKAFFSVAGWDLTGILIVNTCVSIITTQLAFESLHLKLRERATGLAESRIHLIKERLKDKTPLASFSEVLQSEKYDPAFSEILAMYGVETLLFLA